MILGSVVALGAEGLLSTHYSAATPEDATKCVTEATASTVASFNLSDDGSLDFSTAVCWPDGISVK